MAGFCCIIEGHSYNSCFTRMVSTQALDGVAYRRADGTKGNVNNRTTKSYIDEAFIWQTGLLL